MNKERRFGAGCVEQWERERQKLAARARQLLEPSFSTQAKRRFLFGDGPTLADAALHGHTLMLQEASPALLRQLFPELAEHGRRVTEWLAQRGK